MNRFPNILRLVPGVGVHSHKVSQCSEGTVIVIVCRGVTLIFARGYMSLAVAFKGPNVILGLCKCNYSLTVK